MFRKLRERITERCRQRRLQRESVAYWRRKYRELEQELVDAQDERDDANQLALNRESSVFRLEDRVREKDAQISCLEIQVRHMAAWSERWQAILEGDARAATLKGNQPRDTTGDIF